MEIIDKLRKGFLLIAVCLVCLGQTIAQTTVAKIGSDEYTTLQAAVDYANDNLTGDVTITMVADNAEKVIVRQKADLNLTIDGNNHTLNGQIVVDGMGRDAGAETLGITHINFSYNNSDNIYDECPSGAGVAFIIFPKNDESCPWYIAEGRASNSPAHANHAHNVTISHCNFDGTGYSGDMVAVRAASNTDGVFNIKLKDLVAHDMHSLAQLTSVNNGLSITGCKAYQVKGGINLSDCSEEIVVMNDTFDIKTGNNYALRIQENDAGEGIMTVTIGGKNFFNSPDNSTKLFDIKKNTLASSTINITGGVYKGCITESSNQAVIGITGGTFSCDVTDKCAEGYGCYENVEGYPEGWTVLKMYWVTYDPNGATGGSTGPTYVVPVCPTSFTVAENGFTWTPAFEKWVTKHNGVVTGEFAPSESMSICSDTVLYAQWNCVATIDGTGTPYGTLQAAIDYANENMTGDVTIKLLKNTSEVVKLLQKDNINMTIDGQDNTLTGQLFISARQKDPLYEGNFDGANTILIENLNFKYNESYFQSVTSGNPLNGDVDGNGFITFCKNCVFGGTHPSDPILNYSHNVTIKDCNFDADGSNYGIFAVSSIAGSVKNLVIDGCYATNALGLAELQSAKQYTVNNCSTDHVKWGLHLIASEGPHTISNNNIQAENRAVNIAWYTNNDAINFSNNTMTADTVFAIPTTTTACNLNITSGTYIGAIENATTVDAFNISGGTYSEDVSGDPCAEGYSAFENSDHTWTVGKYSVRYYSNNTDDTVVTRPLTGDFPTNITVEADPFGYESTNFVVWNTKADGSGTYYQVGQEVELDNYLDLYLQNGMVARIVYGEETHYYPSLQAAVDYANDNLTGDVTIDLVANTSEVVKILQKDGISIMLNGNDVTLTGQIFIGNRQGTPYPGYTGTYTESNTITIDNLNFAYDGDYFHNYVSGEDAFIEFCKNCEFGNVLNYSHNITISKCDFDGNGSSNSFYGVSAINTVYNLVIDNCTVKNALGLAELQSVTNFTVSNCSAEDVVRGLWISGGGDGTFNIIDNDITATDYAVLLQNQPNSTIVNMLGNTMEAQDVFILQCNDNGLGTHISGASTSVINITSGTYIGNVVDKDVDTFGEETGLNISGGTYSEDVSGEPCAPGYAAFDNGDGTWTVTKAWFLYYDKNHVTAVGTMDTLFVRQDGTDVERTVEVAACEFTCLPDSAFDRWNTQADGLGVDVSVGTELELTSDVTLYAIWKEGFTIFYNNNGGTGEIANQSKDPGVDVTLSDGAAFSRTDSTLYRWNTAEDESGTNYKLGGTYSEDANVTMYAVWRLNLGMTMSSTDVVCYGENNGTDTVKIIGGEMPFKLVLSGTEDRTVTNVMTRTYVFENLKPGAYTVTLTDTLNKDIITGTFTIAQPDTLVISSLTVPDAPCPLMGTGTYAVSMTTTGGNGGNVITWGGDATDVDASETTVTPDADDRDRTYTVNVTVTDQKGCVATATADFTVAPVIANDGTSHSNTTMTVAPISHSILYGCDTVIRDFGTPEFVFTNAAITDAIIDTVYNNVYTIAPDSIFAVGGDYTILWTAVDTCGHTVTAEQVISITHKSCPTVTDLDGNSYPAVRIGCDCWTTKNLASTHYSSDGTEIPDVMTYSATRTRSRAVPEYGYLYTYSAAMHGETVTGTGTTPVQGACPDGWHIPTAAESEALMASTEVRDLMSQGLWIPDNGTNASGFNLLPGGCYNAELDRYERMYVSAYFWIAVPDSYVYHACEFGAACSSTELVPGNLSNGFSIRCVLTKPAE